MYTSEHVLSAQTHVHTNTTHAQTLPYTPSHIHPHIHTMSCAEVLSKCLFLKNRLTRVLNSLGILHVGVYWGVCVAESVGMYTCMQVTTSNNQPTILQAPVLHKTPQNNNNATPYNTPIHKKYTTHKQTKTHKTNITPVQVQKLLHIAQQFLEALIQPLLS